MSGYAVEGATSIEVIAAWVAPKFVMFSVAATPGWYTIGEYFLPRTVSARLDAIGSVSDPSLICRVRLWDTTLNAPVSGGVAFNSATTSRQLGALVNLTGNRRYQVQAECVGAVGDVYFAVVETVTISD